MSNAHEKKPKSGTIDTFKSHFDDGARSNRFHVNFYCPPLGLTLEGWRVESVSLPGRQLQVDQYSTYGPLQQFPYNIDHDGGQLTKVWQDFVYAGSGENDIQGNSIHPQFNYYNEYVGQMEIFQLRRDDSTALKYDVYEVYPISYAAQELNATSPDTLLQFSVTWAFRTYATTITNPPELSLINKGRRWLDVVLDGLKVASRYSKKSNKILNKLESFDSLLSSGQSFGRSLGGGG